MVMAREALYPYKSLCFRRWLSLVWLAVALLASGCGVSGTHKRIWGTHVVSARVIDNLWTGRRLASGKLPGGGRFTVVLASTASQIGYYAEEPAKYGAGHYHKRGMVQAGGARGIRLSAPLHTPLEIDISQSCVGPHLYALAFGVLHDEYGSVTAYADGGVVRFKKANLPSSLGIRVVVVYGLLKRGQNDIVTRTATGRIVSSEVRSGVGVSCKR